MPNKLFQKMAKQFGELDDNGQEWIREEWEDTKKEGLEDGVKFFAIGYYKTGLGILPFCGTRKNAKSGISAKEIDKIIKS
jgi:hypothetical protein